MRPKGTEESEPFVTLTIISIIIVFDPVFLTSPFFHFIQCNALPSKLRLIFALCNLQHIDHMHESLKVTTILARKMQNTNNFLLGQNI